MHQNEKNNGVWPIIEKKRYSTVPITERYLDVYNQHDPNTTVPILVKWNSSEVKNHIPLKNFSKDFQQMYKENFFKRIYYNDGKVTGLSIHNTEFVAKLNSNY